MIDLIKKLIKKNHAYKTDDGSVFFKIDSYKNYGILSKIDFSQLSKTDRVKKDEYDKNFVNDFALWKSRKEMMETFFGILHGVRVGRVGILSAQQCHLNI